MDVYSEINDGTSAKYIKEEMTLSIYVPTQTKDSDATEDDALAHISNPDTRDVESIKEKDYPIIYMNHS